MRAGHGFFIDSEPTLERDLSRARLWRVLRAIASGAETTLDSVKVVFSPIKTRSRARQDEDGGDMRAIADGKEAKGSNAKDAGVGNKGEGGKQYYSTLQPHILLCAAFDDLAEAAARGEENMPPAIANMVRLAAEDDAQATSNEAVTDCGSVVKIMAPVYPARDAPIINLY